MKIVFFLTALFSLNAFSADSCKIFRSFNSIENYFTYTLAQGSAHPDFQMEFRMSCQDLFKFTLEKGQFSQEINSERIPHLYLFNMTASEDQKALLQTAKDIARANNLIVAYIDEEQSFKVVDKQDRHLLPAKNPTDIKPLIERFDVNGDYILTNSELRNAYEFHFKKRVVSQLGREYGPALKRIDYRVFLYVLSGQTLANRMRLMKSLLSVLPKQEGDEQALNFADKYFEE